MMLTLISRGKVGDADKYTLMTVDGREHQFVVTNAERLVDGDEGQSAIRRAVQRYKEKAALDG